MKKERKEFLDSCERILSQAEQAKREMTAPEKQLYDKNMTAVDALTPKIQEIEGMNTLRAQFPNGVILPTPPNAAPRKAGSDGPSAFADMDRFIKTGQLSPAIQAAAGDLTEGEGLAAAVPPFILERFRVIAPQLAPFESAGATIYNSDSFGMVQIKVPFILSGTAVTTFPEGSGPSTTQDAKVVGIELTPAKYAFLTLVSEEADADIPNLGQSLTQEGLSRIYASTSAAATADLLASLTAAGATVSAGADNLESLLNLEAAIPPAFAAPSNALMLSRTSLAKLRGTRDLQDRPIFDPVNKTMLGYRTVINDSLSSKIVFGNWAQGAYLSYSAFLILRLLEAYRQDGKIGIRFARRMASAFFSDASNDAANQPLYSLELPGEVGS